ncbi:MAG: ImmA/IrrE family metallo-endopeptidase [Ruminococcaceae bacterium]|nr:ImmA/IrrE family metallo-endopeptidase [Oscillospiraceae bacterium]
MVHQTDTLPRFSRCRLDELARSTLDELMPGCSDKPQTTDLYRLADSLGLAILEGYLSPRGDILGMTVFGQGLVEYVTPSLEYRCEVMEEGTVMLMPDPSLRQRFTLAHEISHWLLHRDVFGYGRQALRCLCRETALFGDFSPKTQEDWLEWQANAMASCLLMPVAAFCRAVYDANPHFSARPYLVEGIETPSCERTVEHICRTFDVSRTAARIRLRQLGFFRSSAD